MSPASPQRRALPAAGCLGRALACLPLAASLHAQTSATVAPAPSRWSVDAQYLHVGADPIRRHAGSSMGITLARAVGTGHPARTARLELGWLRASRVLTQAQGVTLGASIALPAGPRASWDSTIALLTLRPGAAVLAGWAEAQTVSTTYGWRGLPGTPDAGRTGTDTVWRPARGRTTGAGFSLGADLQLTGGLSLVGSVRHWGFTGPVIRPNRWATLAGIGVAMRPRTFVHDARRWWSGWDAPRPAAARPALRPTVPQDPAALVDTTAAARGVR